MSSSSNMEAPVIVTFQATPLLVSPAEVPQPQARPEPVTANTLASALHPPTFEDTGDNGAGALGGTAGLDSSEPPLHPARSNTQQKIEDWTGRDIKFTIGSNDDAR
jgi:hypothetical protein